MIFVTFYPYLPDGCVYLDLVPLCSLGSEDQVECPASLHLERTPAASSCHGYPDVSSLCTAVECKEMLYVLSCNDTGSSQLGLVSDITILNISCYIRFEYFKLQSSVVSTFCNLLHNHQ